ncbi:hypothetical protein [Pseudochryseolinea flava]|uniref:Uncharacterized protein n=1 Tax=Pseudochryseolinea flava TaxID=2059302 RepID=A0A364XTC8_9BACT|nr:hypothetical protein [Pseudochryseolinea flava]RAV97618.1 hypothetical protein DQQ10_27540 [Pseudochryseolinea flava]
MQIEEIIGKTVTNIYSLVKMEVGGLDMGECFIELDNKIIIDIPFGFSDDIWIKELDKKAINLFADLSDYPVYHVNKDNKSIKEIADNYQRQKGSLFNRLRKVLLGHDIAIKEYQPYKVDYRENKLKRIKDRKIVDFIWYADDTDKGYILFDNGYIITETTITNHGTGLAGLNLYESVNDLMNLKGNDYFKLTDKKGSRQSSRRPRR